MARVTYTESSNAEDLRLANRVKAGDEIAFEQLFKKHREWVYQKALQKLTDPGLAEEVTQDVFIKVWRKLDKWHSAQGYFGAWLNVIAQRTIIDAVRKRNRAREIPFAAFTDVLDTGERLPDTQPFVNYADAGPGPGRQLEMEEARDILESALVTVTKPNHRIAWMLRHLEGYSIKETARILDRKEGTIKGWVFRCTAELRDILVKRFGVNPVTDRGEHYAEETDAR